MTKDEALKLALEALEMNPLETPTDVYDTKYQATITAIKEALAQPEQEPVATDWERIARVQDAKLRAMCNEAGGFEKLCEVMDKYEQTTPPQRKPLTDEEINEFFQGMEPNNGFWLSFARAIEQAHGIKELA